jgi:putative methyltransferase (TIGR04325 family)
VVDQEISEHRVAEGPADERCHHRVSQGRAPLSQPKVRKILDTTKPHFVACGKADFEDEVLKFYDTITQAGTRGKIDLVLFSGALQCLPNPFEVLAICADIGVPHILIDRHPQTDAKEDRIEIQHLREPIYKANYPHRTFARARFEKFMESIGYQMVFSFQGFDGPHYRGFLFSRS